MHDLFLRHQVQFLTCSCERLRRIYLYSADPTQGALGTVDRADRTAATQQHELQITQIENLDHEWKSIIHSR